MENKDYKKLYEDALENLKRIKEANRNNNELVDFIEYKYPELKESDDERMLKAIIGYIDHDQHYGVSNKDMISWLEKQCEQKLDEVRTTGYWNVQEIEQKSADKFEPKFNVGDWLVCCNYEPEQIIGIRNDMYEMSNGDIRPINMINNNHNIRLWTIQDAKDGDVLYIHSSESGFDCVFLYQNTIEIESGRNVAVAYCGIDVYANRIEFGIQGPDCIDVRKIKPATQEQRNLLFTKMKESGYKWDEKNKVLRKIEQKNVLEEAFDKSRKDYSLEEKKEASDYSESIIPTSIAYGESKEEYMLHKIIEAAFIAGQNTKQKSAWSEEDERILVSIMEDVMPCGECPDYPTDEEREYFYEGNRKVDWLKSLKERVQPQPKQELNEEAVNEYVDLGLPSGTLWKSVNEKGYYTFDEAVEKFGNQLPSKEQWGELKDKCNWEWKGDGCKVIGLNGKSIFLPAAGFRARPDVYEVGSTGHYWSCTSDDVEFAYNMYFDKNCIYVNYDYRCLSCSVRLVK